jgi:hypothetical protein
MKRIMRDNSFFLTVALLLTKTTAPPIVNLFIHFKEKGYPRTTSEQCHADAFIRIRSVPKCIEKEHNGPTTIQIRLF